MTKWIVLIAGVIIQTVLGGVYAWSTFVPSLTSNYGLSNGQCGLIFGAIMSVFTLTMIPSGALLKRFGAKLMAIAGTTLFLIGYTLASFSGGNFIILLIGLGVISGAGLGVAYVVPLTVGMKWFPNNKGLITGVSVAGFGLGALLVSFLGEYLLYTAQWDVLSVFRCIGLGLGFVAIFCSFFICEPVSTETETKAEVKIDIKPYLKSKTFLLYCLGLFAGAFAALLTISNLKPIALSIGMPATYAVWLISVFSFGNAIGRVAWGQIHDKLGSRRTIIMCSSVLIFTLIPYFFHLPASLILLTTFAFGIGFGSFAVVYASAIVSTYGIELFPKLYPICFLGCGVAALIGPPTGGFIVDVTGSYSNAIILSMAIVFVSLVIIELSHYKDKSARKEKVVKPITKKCLNSFKKIDIDLSATKNSVSEIPQKVRCNL